MLAKCLLVMIMLNGKLNKGLCLDGDFFVPFILFSLLQLKNVIYRNNLIFTVPKLITHLSFSDYNLPSPKKVRQFSPKVNEMKEVIAL